MPGWRLKLPMRDQATQNTGNPLCVRLLLGDVVIRTGNEDGPDVLISDLARILNTMNASKLDL